MSKKKSIDYDSLRDALSYEAFEPKLQEKRRKERSNFYSQNKSGSYIYDHDAHARFIAQWSIDNGLTDHIKVEKISESVEISESNISYLTKYKIIISDLEIETGYTPSELFLESFVIDESRDVNSTYMKDKYNGGYYLYFLRNEFVQKNKDKNCYLNIILGENAYLRLEDNEFNYVDIYLGSKKSNKFLIDIKRNSFTNRHVTIGGPGFGTTFKDASGFSLQHISSGKLYAAKSLEQLVNRNKSSETLDELKKKISSEEYIKNSDILKYLILKDDLVKVDSDTLTFPEKECLARIYDNSIECLIFSGMMSYYFKGNNKIAHITSTELPPYVFWGAYQSIDDDGRNAHHNKKFFIDLKEKAVTLNDGSQALILNREIKKCDYSIIKDEKSLRAYQDKFIYTFSKLISDHGVSWLRPIGWLAAINIIISVLALLSLQDSYFVCSNFTPFDFDKLSMWFEYVNLQSYLVESCEISSKLSVTFFELFNPTSYLPKLLNVSNGDWLLSLLNIIQKGFYAAIGYDLIKSFRRFSSK